MNNLDLVLELKKSSIFGQLTKQELVSLANVVQEKHFESEDLIVQENKFDPSMYLIISGKVEIKKAGNLLFQLKSGQVFGEMALFEGGVRAVSAYSRGNTKLLVLGRRDMLKLIEEEPNIAIGICRALSRKVRMLNEHLTKLESQ